MTSSVSSFTAFKQGKVVSLTSFNVRPFKSTVVVVSFPPVGVSKYKYLFIFSEPGVLTEKLAEALVLRFTPKTTRESDAYPDLGEALWQ